MFRKLKRFLKPDYLPAGIVFFLILILLVYFFTQYKEGFDDDCSPEELGKRLKSPDKTLVLFYADWCGHCKTLKPAWKEAKDQSNGKMIQLDVGSKDGTHKDLLDEYQIDGFPTILVFQNGKAIPFEGSRTVDSFLEKLN